MGHHGSAAFRSTLDNMFIVDFRITRIYRVPWMVGGEPGCRQRTRNHKKGNQLPNGRAMRNMILVCIAMLGACSVSELRDAGVDGGMPAMGDPAEPPIAQGFTLPSTGGFADPGTWWWEDGTRINLRGAWNVPVILPVGSEVPSIIGSIRDNVPTCQLCLDGNGVFMMLVSYVGTTWTVLGSTTTDGSGAWQRLPLSVNHTVTSDEILRVRFYTYSSPNAPVYESAIGPTSFISREN